MTNLVDGPTRCLLIRPEFMDETFYNLSDVFKIFGVKSAAPPLGLLVLAAHLPSHWQFKLVDEDIEPLTDAHLEWADIVMVSGIGPQEQTMMSVVRRAKRMGKPVVVGGSGPTLQPDFYGEADFVVSGEADDTVPRLLEDLASGATSGQYRSAREDRVSVDVIPRYDLAKLNEYMFIGLQFARGCPFSCEFCAQIEIFGKQTRTKPTEMVIKELQTLYDLGYRGMIDFGYDNLIGDIPRAEEVLEAVVEWLNRHDHPFCFSTEATMNLAKLPKILRLMREADFRYLFVGIESSDEAVLKITKKGQNTAMPAVEAVKIFNAHGIIVYTGLILGFDGETSSTAANVLRMVEETGAFPALVLPLHALPGTALSARLTREGRLFSGDIKVDYNRTDTATTGLNFVTDRPRTEILRDLIHVLEELFDSRNHYKRIKFTATHLKPNYKHKDDLAKTIKIAIGFFQVVRSTFDLRTGPLFWRAMLRGLTSDWQTFALVVGLAAMNTSYAYQAKSYIRALKQQLAYVEQIGEEAFNKQMLGDGAAVGVARIASVPASSSVPASA
jgi:radical SAM superfamily enzyme YgiQ (UPF0313 family)